MFRQFTTTITADYAFFGAAFFGLRCLLRLHWRLRLLCLHCDGLLRFRGRLRFLRLRYDRLLCFFAFAGLFGFITFFGDFAFTFFTTAFFGDAFFSPRRKLPVAPEPFDCFRAPFLHASPQRHLQVLVDDALVFADVVVGHDVFQHGLSGRPSALLQTSDGCCDHLGVCRVSRRLLHYLRLGGLLRRCLQRQT